MRVLVVDDEQLVREGVAELLRHCPDVAETVTAADGFEGLRMLRETVFDVVLCDIRMPEMNGLEMLEKARTEKFFGQAVILSSYADFDYARKAIALNVRGYLLKPVDVEELYAVMSGLKAEAENIPSEEAQTATALRKLIEKGGQTEREIAALPERIVQGLSQKKYPQATAVSLLLLAMLKFSSLYAAGKIFLEKMSFQEHAAKRLCAVTQKAFSSSRMSGILNNSLQYLVQNACSPQTTLADTAQKMHTNASYVSGLFSQTLEISFVQLLNLLRVARAQEYLMMERQRSVSEIAFLCGFENVSHFFRVFKSITYQTPKQYQSQIGGQTR